MDLRSRLRLESRVFGNRIRWAYFRAIFIASKCPPLCFYFRTLRYFRVDEKYRQKLKKSKTVLDREAKKELWREAETKLLEEDLERIGAALVEIRSRLPKNK